MITRIDDGNVPVWKIPTGTAARLSGVGPRQLFDVSEGQPVFIGHVVVGVDPVSVRFRSESELWVVNHISDSISVVDLTSFRVVRTLATADEPSDVVFAGNHFPIRRSPHRPSGRPD